MNSPTRTMAPPNIADLVQEDRVHGDVYASPEIFELEMERIFHRQWLYIGHAGELPNPGDYRVRKMGRQSVIMVRGDDREIRVFMNRCRHRGMAVCEQLQGNARNFTCWYHGWVYGNRGDLLDVTQPQGYGADFDRSAFGLTPAPRVEQYRGFVFASLSSTGESLSEHLGLSKRYFDCFEEASPVGRIDVTAGVQRTVYRGNWKFVGMDGYHPYYTHKSVMDMWQARRDDNLGDTHRGDPFSDDSGNLTRDVGNGHVLLDMYGGRERHLDHYLEGLRKKPGGARYIADMETAYGEERARELLIWAGDPHVGVYPNLQLIGIHIRIVNPIAVDETEVLMFPVLWEGVAPEMNASRLRVHESFYGPSSQGSPDDAELFERNQLGLQADVDPWVYLARGMHREKTDHDGSLIGMPSDETTQRGQFKAWKKMMREPV